MAGDSGQRPTESATAELFRLRRIAVVDGAWHLGFITAFGLSGVVALDSLSTNLGRSPARAMTLYIVLICVAGLIGGVIGAACGHGIATVRERLDLRRNPRHFEADGGIVPRGARAGLHSGVVSMTRAAQSVFVFGIYLLGTGAMLTLAPNVLLGPLGFATATEPWVRVLGIVVAVLGTYYVIAARAELVPFFRATVWIRFAVLVAFGGLAALGWAPPMLILFGVVDTIAALWTWSALRSGRGAN